MLRRSQVISFQNSLLAASLLLLSVGAGSQTSPRAPVDGPTSVFTVTDSDTLQKGAFSFSSAYNTATVRNESVASKLMGRDLPYRVVLPAGYSAQEHASRRYPVIYLLHGLTGHYDNWADKTKLQSYVNDFIVVTPEGENGWYTDSSTKPTDKYESYIIKELIPEVDKKFRTVSDRDHRAIAGLSMGGFGAVKFGLKYPEMFSLAGSFSGALGAATITEKKFPGALGKTIDGIFGPFESEIRKSNDLFDIIRRASSEKIKTLPFLYLDCGTEDFLFQSNREFVELLLEKNVPHEFRQLPGGHNWKYWDGQVMEFLQLAEQRFATTRPGR